MKKGFRKISFAIVSAVGLISAVSIFADFELLTAEYDFGLMKEVEGPKTGKVFLVNRGEKPDFIRQVRPSCGCTDSNFPEGEIAPGDTTWVSFTYNPEGRPGAFRKTVRVVTGEDEARHVIVIKGTVLGESGSLEKYYPVSNGPLRLTEGKILFGNLRLGTARHYFIRGYNQSPDTIYPRMLSENKDLEVECTPEAVAPGEIATLSFYLNTTRMETPGEFKSEVKLIPDTAHPDQVFNLDFIANILPRKDSEVLIR